MEWGGRDGDRERTIAFVAGARVLAVWSCVAHLSMSLALTLAHARRVDLHFAAATLGAVTCGARGLTGGGMGRAEGVGNAEGA